MKQLKSICLIIITINLISCGSLVQPVNSPIKPAQSDGIRLVQVQNSPLKAGDKATGSPQKAVKVTVEKTVVHTNIKGVSVSTMGGPRTPTPTPTPMWVDDNLVVIEPSSPPPIVELQVGQQLAVMPLRYKYYGWDLKYNTNILDLVEDVAQTKVPTAAWIWTAKKEGETTIYMKSISPTPHVCNPMPCALGPPTTTKRIMVKVIP